VKNPGTVAGYTAEAIAAHAEACKTNAWVRANDGANARKREGFVRHLMTIDPPRKRLRLGDGGVPLPRYRQESGDRSKEIFGELCKQCQTFMTTDKDGLCNFCRNKALVEEVRATAAPGSHAERNPELHTGLDAMGNPWGGWECVSGVACGKILHTDNKDRICNDCRKQLIAEEVEEVRATAAPGSHASRNPELHTGLDGEGRSLTANVTKI
jgi:hypothetical protein